MFFKALFAALFLMSSPATENISLNLETPASINLSDVHAIYCSDGLDEWQGTGFLIAKDTMVTANHVQGEHCIDASTGTPLKTYKTDRRHDLALMSGDIPSIGPYVSYNCTRPEAGQYYISYGQSSSGMPSFFTPILRNNTIKATKELENETDLVPDFQNSSGMRVYVGPIASGMSGGPVADMFGVIHAINNAGNNRETLLFDLADTGLCTNKWDD